MSSLADVQPPLDSLDAGQRAMLDAEIAWLVERTEFRRRMVSDGLLEHHWRSVFEADMIFCLIAQHYLNGRPITLKELSTYFELLVTEVTVKRHLDDMEAAGTISRTEDPSDRRRLLLIPTPRLVEIGRRYLDARIATALRHGFVYDPERAARVLDTNRRRE